MGHMPFLPKLELQMPATSTLWLVLKSILRKGHVFRINQQVYESPTIGADLTETCHTQGGSLHVSVWTVKPGVPTVCLTSESLRCTESAEGEGRQSLVTTCLTEGQGTYTIKITPLPLPFSVSYSSTMLLSFFPISQHKRIMNHVH